MITSYDSPTKMITVVLSLVVLTGWISLTCSAQKARFSLTLNSDSRGVAYGTDITVGSPFYNPKNTNAPNEFNLLIDTGSANDFVLGSSCCRQNTSANSPAGESRTTTAAVKTYNCATDRVCTNFNTNLKLSYAVGTVSGSLVKSAMSAKSFGPMATSFLVASDEQTFPEEFYGGILGLGYQSEALPEKQTPFSLLTHLVSFDGVSDAFGLQLCGPLQGLSKSSDQVGKWVVGGPDDLNGTKLYSGDLFYTPILDASRYVVAVTGLQLGSERLDINCEELNVNAAYISSGARNIALPSKAFQTLKKRLFNTMQEKLSKFDFKFLDGGICCETYCTDATSSSALMRLPDLTISLLAHNANIKKVINVSIPPQHYWRPIRRSSGSSTICRIFGISQSASEQVVLGTVFLDGLFTYHDRSNAKVGLAPARNCHNLAEPLKKVTLSQQSESWCACLPNSVKKKDWWFVSGFPGGDSCFVWLWWTYLLLIALILVLLGLLILLIVCIKRRSSSGAKGLDFQPGEGRDDYYFKSRQSDADTPSNNRPLRSFQNSDTITMLETGDEAASMFASSEIFNESEFGQSTIFNDSEADQSLHYQDSEMNPSMYQSGGPSEIFSEKSYGTSRYQSDQYSNASMSGYGGRHVEL